MQEMFTHGQSMPLRLWEGLEEAQVSEPLQSAARAALATSGKDTVTKERFLLKDPIMIWGAFLMNVLLEPRRISRQHHSGYSDTNSCWIKSRPWSHPMCRP